MVDLLDVFAYFLEWLPGEIIRRSFNVELESSFGTWISTSQSLFVGLIAAALFARLFTRITLGKSVGLAIVALFFLYISFDDAAKFHERLGTTIRPLMCESEDGCWSASVCWLSPWR